MNKTILTIIVIIALVVVGAWVGYAFWGETIPEDSTQLQEEPSTFPEPTTTDDEDNDTPQPNSQTIQARIDQEASALGVTIVPLRVLEDSRCPSDVTCVWAGTVRLRALLSSGLGEGEHVFVLDEPITTEAEEVTLVEVEPYPISTESIEPSDYIFTFTIEKR